MVPVVDCVAIPQGSSELVSGHPHGDAVGSSEVGVCGGMILGGIGFR